MDRSSVTNNIFLEVNNGSEPCPGETPPEETTAWGAVKRIAKRVFEWIVPSISAQGENWCPVEAEITLYQNEIGSVAQVYPLLELRENALHRVRVQGDSDIADGETTGVRNIAGVALFEDASTTFTTGEAECSLDVIEVTITPPGEPGTRDVFFCAGRNDCPDDAAENVQGNQHIYHVTGRDLLGYVVPSDYSWVVSSGSDLISLNTEEGEEIEITSGTDNGNATVTVFGEARAPSIGVVSRSVDIRVFICENPWPTLEDFPYTDEQFGYDTFYCRDFGDPGTHDDLPPLSSPIVGENIGSFLQDSLFIVE
jgi:hypothetical protein